jgi:hypothetical protein
MSAPNPYAPPRSNVDALPGEVDIDSLDVSDTWKKRFKAMQKAGGPSLPNVKELSPEDRKAITGFNVIAFFLGPIYYIAKGMWRKAITIFVLGFIALLIIDVILAAIGWSAASNATGIGFAVVWASLANADYYRKMVLGQNGWWWGRGSAKLESC